MTPDNLAARIDGIVEDAEKAFGKQVSKTQSALFEQVQILLKRLDLNPDGTIKQSQENRAILAKAEQTVERALKESGYYQSLNAAPAVIGSMADTNAKYFNSLLESSFTPDAQYIKNLQRQSIDNLETLLANDGLAVALKQPIKSIMTQNINTSASYTDLVAQLRTFIIGSPTLDGALTRYSKQIVTDTLFNYSRAYQEAVSENLGLNWTKYVGGSIATSRPFCLSRVGGYYEKDDVEKWASKDWAGKRQGTTRSTIFIYAGGYNCRHQIIYVSDEAVPHTNKDAKKLMKQAKQVGNELQDPAAAIAKKNGAKITPINYKGYDSMVRKSKKELQGRIYESSPGKADGVKDAVRNTIVTEGKALKNIAQQVSDEKMIVSLKTQDYVSSSGYRGYLLNAKLSNGTYGEIQVNTPEMIFAKEEPDIAKAVIGEDVWTEIHKKTGLPGGMGHHYYEEIREFEDVELTPEIAAKIADLNKRSREYYQNFYYSYPEDWKLPNKP